MANEGQLLMDEISNLNNQISLIVNPMTVRCTKADMRKAYDLTKLIQQKLGALANVIARGI